jgi:hypothetical protein
VIEVYVRQQEMTYRRRIMTSLSDPIDQQRNGARRASVDEREINACWIGNQVGTDDARCALKAEIEEEDPLIQLLHILNRGETHSMSVALKIPLGVPDGARGSTGLAIRKA